MGSSVFSNKQGWSHKGSNAIATNTAPDVCLTQVGSSVVPIPYPNTAKSSDLQGGAKTVTVDGEMPATKGCNYSQSVGDDAGNRKGVASGTHKDKAEFINNSFDIKCEGKGVCRNTDSMTHNNGNTIGTNSDASAEPPESRNQISKTTFRVRFVEHLDWDNYDEKAGRFRIAHENNKPIKGMKLKIKMPDGSIREETTDDNGVIELKDQDPHAKYEINYEAEDEKLNKKYCLFHHGLIPWERDQER